MEQEFFYDRCKLRDMEFFTVDPDFYGRCILLSRRDENSCESQKVLDVYLPVSSTILGSFEPSLTALQLMKYLETRVTNGMALPPTALALWEDHRKLVKQMMHDPAKCFTYALSYYGTPTIACTFELNSTRQLSFDFFRYMKALGMRKPVT